MIIGFSGPAGAGKSTAAKHLVDNCGFTLVKFAGPLKAMLRAIIPGDDVNEWIEGSLKETVHPVLGQTPRHAMQTLGTEWGRNCMGQDFWVKLARESILSAGDDVVIDDVRFQNEVDLIRSLGGKVIQIKPKVITHRPTHASELPCDYDAVVYNDGSVVDLHRAITALR
jgi:hypothetical protein